jgi:hypothetical protein
MNPLVKCPKCGTQFEQDQPWKKVCLDCYLAEKERRESRNFDQLREQVAYWKGKAGGEGDPDELIQLRRKVDQLQSEIIRLQLALMTARNQSPPSRHNGQGIPQEMLRRLIQLSHPDRHGNSEAATKATRWLLEQRQ